jgi:hypothetical protein
LHAWVHVVWVHVVDFGGEDDVFGMRVSFGDIIHTDHHGAEIVPPDAVLSVPEVLDRLVRREAVLIGAARQAGFCSEKLAKTIADAEEGRLAECAGSSFLLHLKIG